MRRNITEGDTSGVMRETSKLLSRPALLLLPHMPTIYTMHSVECYMFGIKYYLIDKCFSNNEAIQHTKPRYEDSFNRSIQNALFNLGKTDQKVCLTAFGLRPSSMIIQESSVSPPRIFNNQYKRYNKILTLCSLFVLH